MLTDDSGSGYKPEPATKRHEAMRGGIGNKKRAGIKPALFFNMRP